MRVRDGASVVRAYIQQAESMESTRWASTGISWQMALEPANNAETGCA
jgi:hypothetical protein